MNIIQHNEPFDFNTLFEHIDKTHIGLDLNGLDFLSHRSNEIHSFIGRTAEWKDRVNNAIGYVFEVDDFAETLIRSKAAYLILFLSRSAERPITEEEILKINDFISGIPDGCDFDWAIQNDETLGNAVKAIILLGV